MRFVGEADHDTTEPTIILSNGRGCRHLRLKAACVMACRYNECVQDPSEQLPASSRGTCTALTHPLGLNRLSSYRCCCMQR